MSFVRTKIAELPFFLRLPLNSSRTYVLTASNSAQCAYCSFWMGFSWCGLNKLFLCHLQSAPGTCSGVGEVGEEVMFPLSCYLSPIRIGSTGCCAGSQPGLMGKYSLEGISGGPKCNLLPWPGQTSEFRKVAQLLRHRSNFSNLKGKERSDHRPQTHVGQNMQPEDCQNIYLVIHWSWRNSGTADILYFFGLCHSVPIR